MIDRPTTHATSVCIHFSSHERTACSLAYLIYLFIGSIDRAGFDLLDAPVKRLCMDDAPVPYASSMEKAVVKRAEDLVEAMQDMINKKI